MRRVPYGTHYTITPGDNITHPSRMILLKTDYLDKGKGVPNTPSDAFVDTSRRYLPIGAILVGWAPLVCIDWLRNSSQEVCCFKCFQYTVDKRREPTQNHSHQRDLIRRKDGKIPKANKITPKKEAIFSEICRKTASSKDYHILRGILLLLTMILGCSSRF